ncbi:MAG: hypothetical protein MHM6MM_001947 [Cercozoa sp. M6MM]
MRACLALLLSRTVLAQYGQVAFGLAVAPSDRYIETLSSSSLDFSSPEVAAWRRASDANDTVFTITDFYNDSWVTVRQNHLVPIGVTFGGNSPPSSEQVQCRFEVEYEGGSNGTFVAPSISVDDEDYHNKYCTLSSDWIVGATQVAGTWQWRVSESDPWQDVGVVRDVPLFEAARFAVQEVSPAMRLLTLKNENFNDEIARVNEALRIETLTTSTLMPRASCAFVTENGHTVYSVGFVHKNNWRCAIVLTETEQQTLFGDADDVSAGVYFSVNGDFGSGFHRKPQGAPVATLALQRPLLDASLKYKGLEWYVWVAMCAGIAFVSLLVALICFGNKRRGESECDDGKLRKLPGAKRHFLLWLCGAREVLQLTCAGLIAASALAATAHFAKVAKEDTLCPSPASQQPLCCIDTGDHTCPWISTGLNDFGVTEQCSDVNAQDYTNCCLPSMTGGPVQHEFWRLQSLMIGFVVLAALQVCVFVVFVLRLWFGTRQLIWAKNNLHVLLAALTACLACAALSAQHWSLHVFTLVDDDALPQVRHKYFVLPCEFLVTTVLTCEF